VLLKSFIVLNPEASENAQCSHFVGERQKQRLQNLMSLVERDPNTFSDASPTVNGITETNSSDDHARGGSVPGFTASQSCAIEYNSNGAPVADAENEGNLDLEAFPLHGSNPDIPLWNDILNPVFLSLSPPPSRLGHLNNDANAPLPSTFNPTFLPIPEVQQDKSSAISRRVDPRTFLSARTLCRFLLGSEDDADKLSLAFKHSNVSIRDIIMAGISAVSFPHMAILSSNETVAQSRVLPASKLCLPDPRSNLIPITRVSLFEACLANASMMGVSRESALEEARESLFHQAFLSSNDVLAVTLQYSYLKPDLRPSSMQIQNSHFFYTDLLPFPEFRDRYLTIRQIEPPVFEESELCHDIDEGGIICWGNNHNGGSPWDRRSWEFKHEFLKKWWMLTGGPDSELWKQSRWWAETRGEKW
jgi:hypothetical protein